MKMKEFMNKTNLSRKTAAWLHDHVFNTNIVKGKHKTFTEENVKYVLDLQYEHFSKVHNIKLIEDSDYPAYVEDNGNVYTYRRGIMEPYSKQIIFGYEYVTLWINNRHKKTRVHRLVAQYFIGPCPDGMNQVNHKDGNKKNNHVSNLEWSNASLNGKHAFENKLSHNDRGFNDSQSHPIAIYDNEENLIAIFSSISMAAKYTNFEFSTLTGLANDPNRESRKYNIQVRYILESDQRCNDYPEIVHWTIGVGPE